MLDLARDETRGERRAATRHEEVDAEAAARGAVDVALADIVVGEVDRAVTREVVDLVRVEDVLRDLEHLVGRADARVEVLQHAAVADAGAQAALHDQVRALDPDDGLEPGDPRLAAFALGRAAMMDREGYEQFVAGG